MGNSLKRGILRYSLRVSKGFTKPTRKFIADMVFGIAASRSCKLTDISRALQEEISLKKVVDRLGRNLAGFSGSEALRDNYFQAIRPSVAKDTLLLIDPSDVTKPHSPTMEAIGSVYDASAKKFGAGYWTLGVVALTRNNKQPIPVYEKLYPCKKQGGNGLAAETKAALQYLRDHFDKIIPRVFDRGFDSGNTMRELVGHGEKFIIRQNQNRVAVHNGKRTYLEEIVKSVDCRHTLRYQSRTGDELTCKIGMTTVVLPNLGHMKLNLVVCRQAGEKPLVLYTNLNEAAGYIAVRVVKAYLMRWRIDEMYGFKKQSFDFEDFRVRSLRAIQTLDLLLTVAIGYLGVLCDKAEEEPYVLEVISASKRVKKVIPFLKDTKFLYYSILDGIISILGHLRCGIAHYFSPPPHSMQLCFPGF